MTNVEKGLGKNETGTTELVTIEKRKTKACIDEDEVAVVKGSFEDHKERKREVKEKVRASELMKFASKIGRDTSKLKR
jgi:hypothetical protein